MKFLLIGDRHASPIAPLSRIDEDFEDTCRNKDNEILKIAKENNVEAILEAGDFFEEGRSRLSNEFIQQMILRWFGGISLKEILEKKDNLSDEELITLLRNCNNIKMIGVPGNHELQGGAPESLPNTTLGLFNSLGYIQLPTKENPILFNDKNTGKSIAITSTYYHPLMDTEGHLEDYIIDKKAADFHIHMVHGMLTDRNLGPGRVQTLIDQITHTKADITFCGHIHTGFKTCVYDGKYFINPGSVIRLSASKTEMTRQVHVVLVDITDKITIKEIPLISAKPGNEVLSRNHIISKNERESISEYYDSEVESYNIAKSRNINDVLEDVMNKEGVSDEVKKSYQDKINSKKAMLTKSIAEQKDTWIKKVEIINFQSHAHQVLDFSPNMNLFVGESDNGKSAILRAISWVYTGKPSGVSVVRYGENFCEVIIELANKTKISHKITLNNKDKTKASSNTYKIEYSDGTSETGNTRLLPKIQELMGFCGFSIDDEQTLDINFMKQGEGWFLIGDEVSSPQRAKIIGAIMNTNCVDSCMKDCDKELRLISQQISLNNNEIKKMEEQEASYSDLPEQKIKIEEIENILSEANKINEIIKKLLDLKKKISNSQIEIKKQDTVIEALSKSDYLSAIDDVKSALNHLISIVVINDRISNSKLQRDKLDILTSSLGNIENVEILLRDLNNRSKNIIEISAANALRKNSINSLDNCKVILEQSDNIYQAKTYIDEINKILISLNRIYEIKEILILRKKYVRNTMIISEKCKNIDNVQIILSENSELISKIENLLKAKENIAKSKRLVLNLEQEIKDKTELSKQIENKRVKLINNFDICPVCGNKLQNGGHSHDI